MTLHDYLIFGSYAFSFSVLIYLTKRVDKIWDYLHNHLGDLIRDKVNEVLGSQDE